jgi:hypothetical protein
VSVCKHYDCWELDGWGDANFESIHKVQSDPGWLKVELDRRKGTADLHRFQTYRLAVRQGCRERGLPVKYV